MIKTDETKAELLLLNLAIDGYQILNKSVVKRSKTENIIRVNELHEDQTVILIAVPKKKGIFRNLGKRICQKCNGTIKDNKCVECGKRY